MKGDTYLLKWPEFCVKWHFHRCSVNLRAHYFVLLIRFFYNSSKSVHAPLRYISTQTITTICKNTYDDELIKKFENANISNKRFTFYQTIMACIQFGRKEVTVA